MPPTNRRRPRLSQRLRKLIGTPILVAIVIVYALLAMTLAARVLPETAWYTQLAFYAVGGFLWIPPSMFVIWWMTRPDEPDDR